VRVGNRNIDQKVRIMFMAASRLFLRRCCPTVRQRRSIAGGVDGRGVMAGGFNLRHLDLQALGISLPAFTNLGWRFRFAIS